MVDLPYWMGEIITEQIKKKDIHGSTYFSTSCRACFYDNQHELDYKINPERKLWQWEADCQGDAIQLCKKHFQEVYKTVMKELLS